MSKAGSDRHSNEGTASTRLRLSRLTIEHDTGGSIPPTPEIAYSEAVEDVFRRHEVTADGLRILYDEMLTHVDRTYVALGNDVVDELFERCRTDFQRITEGRLAELADSIERLRVVVYRLERRVELIEQAPIRAQRAPHIDERGIDARSPRPEQAGMNEDRRRGQAMARENVQRHSTDDIDIPPLPIPHVYETRQASCNPNTDPRNNRMATGGNSPRINRAVFEIQRQHPTSNAPASNS